MRKLVIHVLTSKLFRFSLFAVPLLYLLKISHDMGETREQMIELAFWIIILLTPLSTVFFEEPEETPPKKKWKPKRRANSRQYVRNLTH